MKDPNFRVEWDDRVGGFVRWCRFIQDNDRGDEDPLEGPKWSICGTVLDPVTLTDPIESIVLVHEVRL